jgi:hypothetical protein
MSATIENVGNAGAQESSGLAATLASGEVGATAGIIPILVLAC